MSEETNPNGRDAQPLRRPARPETTAARPLVSAQRGRFTVLPEVTLERLAADNLRAYCGYVCAVEGTEPEDGAVISAALEMLFAADAGFARWQQEQHKKGRATPVRASAELAPAGVEVPLNRVP